MAIRIIREEGDPVLNKVSKPVKVMTPRLKQLVKDMFETMYQDGGVGLAAPQVGMLKRIVVIDTSEDQSDPHVLVNPEIIEQDGSQTGMEGCLSVPGKIGKVTRPNHVIAKAFDENMQPIELEGEELLARAICHELDHLDGHLYTEIVEGPILDSDEYYREQEEAQKKEQEKNQ